MTEQLKQKPIGRFLPAKTFFAGKNYFGKTVFSIRRQKLANPVTQSVKQDNCMRLPVS